MNKTRLFPCLLCALAAAASAAEHLWTDFDASPTGSVANVPGWTRAAWLGGITGRIDNINYSHSPSNILELPWNATASSAVFTNFNSTYTTNEHPVVRCSAKLHCSNTNAFSSSGCAIPAPASSCPSNPPTATASSDSSIGTASSSHSSPTVSST